MWWGEINVRVLRIVHATPLSIRIIRGGHFAEVAAGPCVDGDAEHGDVE